MNRNPFHAILFALLAAFFTMGAGCQSVGGFDTPQQQIMASCVAADGALQALTVARRAGKLSDAQAEAIETAGDKIAIICMADEPPTLDSVRQAAFEEAIRTLTTLKDSTGGP